MANTRSKRTNIEMFIRHHWEQAEHDIEKIQDFVACLVQEVNADDNELRKLRERLKVVKLFQRLHELPHLINGIVTMLEKDPDDQSFE
jgi:hypothetical protein